MRNDYVTIFALTVIYNNYIIFAMESNLQHTTYSMITAQLLNERRAISGISQAKFLERAGMSQSSWSRINRGLSHFSLEELRASSEVLSVDMAAIISDADQAAKRLPKEEGVEILESTKATENKSLLPTIIAAAALAFLVARLLKGK